MVVLHLPLFRGYGITSHRCMVVLHQHLLILYHDSYLILEYGILILAKFRF